MSEALSVHKKRRGVARASITKLSKKITELETLTSDPDTCAIAQRLVSRLKELNTEFRTHHLAIVDLTDSEEELSAEQDALDYHDDKVGNIEAHLQQLLTTLASLSGIDPKRIVLKRLTHLKGKLWSIGESGSAASEDMDGTCKLHRCHQHEEQLSDLKADVREI